MADACSSRGELTRRRGSDGRLWRHRRARRRLRLRSHRPWPHHHLPLRRRHGQRRLPAQRRVAVPVVPAAAPRAAQPAVLAVGGRPALHVAVLRHLHHPGVPRRRGRGRRLGARLAGGVHLPRLPHAVHRARGGAVAPRHLLRPAHPADAALPADGVDRRLPRPRVDRRARVGRRARRHRPERRVEHTHLLGGARRQLHVVPGRRRRRRAAAALQPGQLVPLLRAGAQLGAQFAGAQFAAQFIGAQFGGAKSARNSL